MSTITSDNTSALTLDLVSQFLIKLLNNDPKFTFYLKHWNAFRDVMTKAPFSFHKAISYICELNLDSSPKSASPKHDRILQKQHSSPVSSDFKLNLLGSLTHIEDKIYPKTQSFNELHPHSDLKINSQPSDDFLKGLMSTPKNPHTHAFVYENSPSETTKEASDSSLTISNLSPSDLLSEKKTKPYSLLMLADRSKKLQDMISIHSDTIETKSNTKSFCPQERRSPLKKVKVFGKRSDAGDIFQSGYDPLSFLVIQDAGSNVQLGKLFC